MRKVLLCLIFSVFHLHGTPFVTVFLNGQLGNQLHQVVAALSVAMDNGAEAVFPELRLRSDKDIPQNYAHVLWRLNAEDYPAPISIEYREPWHGYTPIPYTPNMKLIGHYQSYKYFDHHRKTWQELFAPKEEMVRLLKSKHPEVVSHPCSVAIHVRTYNREDVRHSIFSKCLPAYFKDAVSHFPKDALFVVFSDDIPWCKKYLSKIASNLVFIENSPHWEDFYLISLCKHQVITNSTFSWWAAYLNTNPDKKIVAPQNWFTKNVTYDVADIVPPDWIMIDNRQR